MAAAVEEVRDSAWGIRYRKRFGQGNSPAPVAHIEQTRGDESGEGQEHRLPALYGASIPVLQTYEWRSQRGLHASQQYTIKRPVQ